MPQPRNRAPAPEILVREVPERDAQRRAYYDDDRRRGYDYGDGYDKSRDSYDGHGDRRRKRDEYRARRYVSRQARIRASAPRGAHQKTRSTAIEVEATVMIVVIMVTTSAEILRCAVSASPLCSRPRPNTREQSRS